MMTVPYQAVLTRPAGLNAALEKALSDAGWGVTISPALSIRDRMLEGGEILPQPNDFDLIVFVSANAVAGYAKQCQGRINWPASTLAACVGVATAAAVKEAFGVHLDVLHPAADAVQDSESLWALIRSRQTLPRRVLIIRGQDGRDWLAEQFDSLGISVCLHVAYCRELATWTTDNQNQFLEWSKHNVRAVWLLTSTHGIESVMSQISQAGLADWAVRCSYIVTHPRLADCLRRLLGGLQVKAQSTCVEVSRGDLTSLVSCFEKIRQNQH